MKILSIIFLSLPLTSAFTTYSRNCQTNLYKRHGSTFSQRQLSDANIEIKIEPVPDVIISEETKIAKQDLKNLSLLTDRGFKASRADRQKAKDIVAILAKNNPTAEPASAYYTDSAKSFNNDKATLYGKWTLIYTDAPDITSLSNSGPTAQLGKIGQECNPPLIKNVIEWKRPDWASSLPFSGNENSRILQKVCCEGVANPNKPTEVDLKIVGLDLLGVDEENFDSSNNSFNGPASLLKQLGPLELRGFLKPPFGKFEILYLDEEMRVIRTYQGYLAVNIREDEECNSSEETEYDEEHERF